MARTKSTRGKLRDTTQLVNLYNFIDYRSYLSRLLKKHQEHLPSYKFNNFSDDLGFKFGNDVNAILYGKRRLTTKMAKIVCASLALKNEERRYFLKMVEYNNAAEQSRRDELFGDMVQLKAQAKSSTLSQEQLTYFGQWWNPVLREMAGAGLLNRDLKEIQKNLVFPLKPERIQQSLEFLENNGFIQWNPHLDQYELPDNQHIETAREVDFLALYRYHQKMIQMAQDSLTRTHESRRDVVSITASIDDAKVAEIKEIINDALEKVKKIEETCSGKRNVYQVNVQLFPFTKWRKN